MGTITRSRSGSAAIGAHAFAAPVACATGPFQLVHARREHRIELLAGALGGLVLLEDVPLELVVGPDVEQDVRIQEDLADLAEGVDRGDVPAMNTRAGEQQGDVGVGPVRAIDGVEAAEELPLSLENWRRKSAGTAVVERAKPATA